ncbi:MAG: sterol desaturase family protein [Bacteroidota bacterium]
MKSILETLTNAGYFELIIFGLILNFGIFFCSLGLYSVLSNFRGSRQIGDQQPIVQSDVVLSLITVLCNTLVFILGVLLWKHGFIALSENQYWLRVLAEVLFLTLIMDFLMYVFHRLVHFLRHFRQIHERHHTHQSTNMLSLFVLHPIESIGFGLMMLVVICFIPFSAIGISLYLLINSLWGTVGHLHHTVLPPFWLNLAKKSYVCTSEFHYLHHQNPDFNFGFYSSIWDVLFKTLHPALKGK